MDREEAIQRIKAGLRRRSGKQWSVTGGRGTAWGWLRIDAPPTRRRFDWEGQPVEEGVQPVEGRGYMSLEDRRELAALLGLTDPIHPKGESVPASHDHRQEYVDRAEGRTPSRVGVPYWD